MGAGDFGARGDFGDLGRGGVDDRGGCRGEVGGGDGGMGKGSTGIDGQLPVRRNLGSALACRVGESSRSKANMGYVLDSPDSCGTGGGDGDRKGEYIIGGELQGVVGAGRRKFCDRLMVGDPE